MKLLMLAAALAWGSAGAAWSQVTPSVWLNRTSPADGNFPRVSAVLGDPSELGSNFLTAVFVSPGAAFDLGVSCVTMTNAGTLNGSLVASFNTFTFRQTVVSDALRTGLQSKDDVATAKAALGICGQPTGTTVSTNVLPVYLLKGQKMALSFPASGMVVTLASDAEGRIVPTLGRSQAR